MTGLAAAVFVSSLFGSLHCIGMCGPLAAVYAGSGDAGRAAARWLGHGAYSVGRLVAYAAIGAVAGSLGAALDRAGAALAGVERAAAVGAGALITLWGLHAFLLARGIRAPALGAPSFLKRGFGRALGTVEGRHPAIRALLLGLFSACLPCGWLYAFAVTAAGTGSPARGALLMAVFWTGTLPVMLSFGEMVRLLAGPVRRHVPATCAVILMILGLWAVVGRGATAARAHVGDDSHPPACHDVR